MNERIKQLAEQAGMNIVDDKFSTYGKFAEKFAQLIVQECADLFEVEYGQSQVSGKEVAEVVKKHFGVEE